MIAIVLTAVTFTIFLDLFMDLTWMWMTLCHACEVWGTVATGCWRGYSGMCLFWVLQCVSTKFNFHSWLADSIEEIQDLEHAYRFS